MDKCPAWAIVTTMERKDGTWYTETITEIDDDTASSVDTFLTDSIVKIKKKEKYNAYEYVYCHGTECHKKHTQDRIRGVKGSKVLRTKKIKMS